MIKDKLLFIAKICSSLCVWFVTNPTIAKTNTLNSSIVINWIKSESNFIKPDSIIIAPEIAAGTTKICIGNSVELKVKNSIDGEIIWKTSSNEIVGTGNTLKVSPKKSTTYYAVFKAGNKESEASNRITISVSTPSFTGLPSLPADYKLTSDEPFYLGTKESPKVGVQLQWKHEKEPGGITLIKPTSIPINYYLRYEEPNTGCVSDWKSVSVSLATNISKEQNQPTKNLKVLANIPAASCTALSTSSDAQLCSGTSFPALVNNTTNGGTGSTRWGCLSTRPNQSWFYFIPLTSGSVSFTVTNTANVDVDGAIWGPVNTVNDACIATQSTPLTCDYTSSANIALSIPSVTAGRVYVLVITNYSNRATTINFPTNSGTASIGCCTLTGATANTTSITCNGGTSTATVGFTGTPTGAATYSRDGSNFQSSNIFSGLTAGTYTFYVRDNVCTKFTTVTISQPTAITFGTPTITNITCSGGNNGRIVIAATGGTGAISYSISPNIGTQSPSGTFNNLTVGTYSITATDANGCTRNTNVSVTETNITPNPPTSVASSPSTICSGQSSTLSANCSSGTPTWYTDAALTATTSSTVSPTSTTTYYVSCVGGGGCKSTSGSVTVNVNPTPSAPTSISASPSTICSGQSSTLAATCSIGTTTWYSDAALTNVISNTVSPSSTSTYYVACVSAAGCKSTPGNVTVNVNPTPTAPTAVSASPSTICSGQSSTLSANCSSGTTTWYSDAALTNVIPSSVSPNTTTTYYVACLSNTGCRSNSGNISVTVNPTPSAPTGISASPSTICSGQSTTLTATCTGSTTTWYSDAALTNVISNSVSPSITTTYFVACVSGAGCKSTSGNISVTVNPTPSAPTSIAATPSTICLGQSSSLTATCSSGTATWYSDINLTTSVSSPVSPTSTTTYYVACVSTAGCKSTSGNITVTVNPTPSAPTGASASPATICVGQSSNLSATCSSGTVTWYTNSALTTSVSTPVSPTITTTYFVACVSTSGCKSNALNVTVNVNPTPSAPTGISASPTTICSGQSSTLSASCSTGIATWYSDAGLTTTVSNPVRPSTTTTYYVSCVSPAGCKSTAGSIVVNVNQTPPALSSSTTEYCQGNTASQLSVMGAPGATVLWYSAATGGVGSTTAPTPSTSTVGITNYYVSQTQNGCETERATIAVVINPNPSLTLTASTVICAGSTATIIASTAGGTPNYEYSKDGTNFQSGNIFTGIAAGTYTITVKDSKGCINSQPITITQNDPLALTTESSNDCTVGNNAIITISGTGGKAPLTYNINGGSYGSTTTFANLAAGNYTVGVKDDNGCVLEKTLNVNTVPDLTISIENQNNCIVGNTGNVTVSATGGLEPYQFRIDGGSLGGNTFNGLSAGVHTAEVVDARGCTKTINIEIIEKPNAPTVVSPTICVGQSVTLSGACLTGVNLWYTDASLTTLLPSTTVSPSSTTNYYATCEIVARNCKSTVSIATVTVNPIPTVNSILNKILCNGTNTTAISFTGSVSGTIFNWTNSNPAIGLAASGTGNIAAFTAINLTNSPISGTITVTPSYTNNGVTCTGTAQTFTITVNPTPNVNPFTNQALCNGSQTTTIVMSGTVTGTVYDWTNTNTNIGLAASGTGNIAAFTATNSTNLPISGTITVTPSFTNGVLTCTGTPQNFTISVNPTPTVNSVASQTLCSGSTTTAINLSGAVSGTVYNWTNSNTAIGLAASGSGNIAAFTANNTGNTPITANIVVTPSYSNNGITCVGASQNFSITVNPIPVVNSITDQTLCNGSQTSAVVFTGTVSGTIYNWINTNTGIGLAASGSGNIGAFTATNNGTSPIFSTITVTPSYTNNGITCTGLPQSFDITVNPTPAVNPINNQTLCNGSATNTVSFTGAVSGTIYNWTNTNTSIGLAASGSGNIPSFATTNSGTSPISGMVTVTPTFTNNGVSCSGTPGNFTITVNPIPTANPISNQILCNNSQTTAVSFSGAVSGTVYNWTNTNTSIGLAASGSGNIAAFTAINTSSTPISSTITVTPTYTNNGVTCTGSTQNFTITVNPTPTINSITNQSLCNGAISTPVNFTGAVSGTIYNWTNSNTGIGLAGTGTGNIDAFTVTNTGSTSISGVISVTPSYTNEGVTCIGTAQNFTITANPIPQAVVTPGLVNICSGDNVNIAITDGKSVNGTTSYSWTRDNTSNLTGLNSGSTSSISGVLNNVTSQTQITAFFATVTSQFGCSDMAIAKVSVTPPLSVSISGNTYFCGTGVLNRSTTLTASPVGGTGSYEYQWNLNGNPITGATNSTYNASTGGDYSVTVVSEFCTKISNTITVNPAYSLTGIPTVNPSSATFCGSGSATFTASSSVSLGTFNWYSSANSVSSLSPTSGTRNETYSTPTLSSSQTYYVARAFVVVGSNPLITCETDRTSVNVTVNQIPTTPIAIGTTVICSGVSTNLSISNSCAGTLTWRNSSNIVVGTGSPLNITPSTTTSYTAICTESGCVSAPSNIVTVTVSNITATATPSNLTCNANNSGSISLTANGGTSPYQYSINGTNFQSNNVFSTLTAGNYTLTIRDATGCTTTVTTSITQPAILTLTPTSNNLTCNANNSGSISLTANGGTTPYQYSINGTNFQSSNAFNSLAAGTYTVTVNDANLCAAT
ncbi:MAG: PKD-like domain-containing protein, partial [Emticicia sp.]|uniref:Ig-like domain-containing protein n=1 Tax=Emticicia sp. TaxID=1930953 RepID=UPI003BA6CDF5